MPKQSRGHATRSRRPPLVPRPPTLFVGTHALLTSGFELPNLGLVIIDEQHKFGVTQREHAARYDFAQEWLDAVKRAWSEPGEFDFDGQFLRLKGVRAYPKPYGGSRPIIMNAGSSEVGQAFALRNCDAFFS